MTPHFFARRKILKNSNTLDLIPVPLHEHIILEDESVQVMIQKFKNKNFQFFLLPRHKSEFIKIKLDIFGSATWKLMDAQINVRSICEALHAQFGDQIAPVEERVSKFIFLMYQNKLISFTQLMNTNK